MSGGEEVVRTYIDIMNKLDLDAFADLVTDDVVVRLPYAPDPVPKVTEGKAGVVGLYGGFPSLVSPLGFHDLVITPLPGEGEFLATYRSDCTMLATGNPYRNDYIATFTVRGDKLAAFTEYFDPLVFVTAGGATVQAPG
ncbi:ketosteroid isomerase-like protein [Pseudonocardia sediminis]|uniref:Ketosteroid isomerase-like protein n=1 Tax=Pseudonocardia sediminis TaxID=1397368 RepID=A0A4Q7UWM4_PSEST|nr:nuclear transport factor 2 family protein [Pseudonocardia sediminis]RZT84499.1 ketosteroid isomerase-like protein [Pseudonocardia sediminis]